MKQAVNPEVNAKTETTTRPQRTVGKITEFSGIGVHTGNVVTLRFCPAKEGTGVQFKRVDLPGQPIIPASLNYVLDTSRSTTIGVKEGRIHTVEHVLAAVKSCGVDNLCIEISNIEPPVGNGSSDVFVEMLERGGFVEQKALTHMIKVREPLYWADDEIQIVALPYEGYRISYTLCYPASPILNGQFHTVVVNHENFKREIAPCRTFSLYQEISPLLDRGLIKGASLNNGVVIKDDVVLSKEGLFFPNEMARHKILDMIGDLSLIGVDFHAHIISIRSGHGSNFAFAKKLSNYFAKESSQ